VPIVSGLRQSNDRWRTSDAPGRSRLPTGTTFRFKLDRAAQVRLAFLRIAPGHRPKPCGALGIAGKAGANAYPFQGEIRARTLKPGRYRLLISANADGMTSAGASLGFTIAR
jgi:hypothetical protein